MDYTNEVLERIQERSRFRDADATDRLQRAYAEEDARLQELFKGDSVGYGIAKRKREDSIREKFSRHAIVCMAEQMRAVGVKSFSCKFKDSFVTELDVSFEDEREKTRIHVGTPKIYPCTSEPTSKLTKGGDDHAMRNQGNEEAEETERR